MQTKKLQLTIIVGELVKDSWLAMTSIAGVPARSNRAGDPVNAVRNLFATLSTTGDAEFSIAMALDGASVDDLTALTQGSAAELNNDL